MKSTCLVYDALMPVEPAHATPEWLVLLEMASILDELKLPYMLTGSMALNLYAVPRMTRDLDIVIELPLDRVGDLSRRLGDQYYGDQTMMRDAITHRFMFNVIRYEPSMKVDFVIRKDEPYRREEFSRRRMIDVHGVSLAVVSPEDLVLSKLVWARESRSEVQFRDVRSILLTVRDLDWEYLGRWAAVLEVAELLEEVRA